jgi:hypothetical protein
MHGVSLTLNSFTCINVYIYRIVMVDYFSHTQFYLLFVSLISFSIQIYRSWMVQMQGLRITLM